MASINDDNRAAANKYLGALIALQPRLLVGIARIGPFVCIDKTSGLLCARAIHAERAQRQIRSSVVNARSISDRIQRLGMLLSILHFCQMMMTTTTMMMVMRREMFQQQ
jgi:hypothetical protein